MTISIFDLFSIGIGPSSSHTVGPMLAAAEFVDSIPSLSEVHSITIDLYGSLALTGTGHGTDKAIINGLEGALPHNCDPEQLVTRLEAVRKSQRLRLQGKHEIHFSWAEHLRMHDEFLPKHSNGLRFAVFDSSQQCLQQETYYSIGGGFIVTAAQYGQQVADQVPQPFPFSSGLELLKRCQQEGMSIAELMLENEKAWRDEKEIKAQIANILSVMSACIDKGCHTEGLLPGGLDVKRRAPGLYQHLVAKQGVRSVYEDADILNMMNMYAFAVNEENAAGGRIVTAPTNGAAGVIPAVMQYYKDSHENVSAQQLETFFLTAGAIGLLYKKNASISGAEVGCQGEVGVASSMAAAGLTAALGGNVEQVENAAEIAMEHHLGMTCDPIAGLVQIPCIERNAMGAVKAVNAARMALIGDGQHKVSLDKVIATMYATGRDMNTIYKETSLGGLAVNIIEC